jgi:glycosyltransferase involved in cell wall biosynthesis
LTPINYFTTAIGCYTLGNSILQAVKPAPKYSVVVPVYNRPHELNELLASLREQTFKNFEVIIVEDGSTISSKQLVANYEGQLTISYYYKENTGPGPSRNYGFERAAGEYLVVFDSDCVLPSFYFQEVENALNEQPLDAWGGPDRGHPDFTMLQQAMAYTMSSFLTTGGIRGGKKKIGTYQPRSFNMGLSKNAWQITKGFQFDRLAEDIELSVRMKKLKLRVELITGAFVYHKRRSTLSQFFHQVFNFGRGRILVGIKHQGEVKWVHWVPSLFTIGFGVSLIGLLVPNYRLYLVGFVAIYFFLIAADALRATKSIQVAILSIPSAFVQLTGYGLGFLSEKLKNLHL